MTLTRPASLQDMAGYLDKVEVGLDVASSEFKVEGENAYDLDFKTTGPEKDTSLKLSGDELMALYKDIADRYPIVTMEDPFDQNGQPTSPAFRC